MLKFNKNFFVRDISDKRYKHIIGVIESSKKLAERYSINKKKVFIAAALHDIAKEIHINGRDLKKIFKNDRYLIKIPPVWHSFIGSLIAKERFKITDNEILDAIKYHTTGHPEMNEIAKIIFIADFIEPGRKYKECIDVRKKLKGKMELDKILLLVLEKKLIYLINNNKIIHPYAINLWNKLRSRF